MRIGVLGTGMVGRAISGKLAELGHDVRVGSRTAGEGTVEFADAAAHGELVFNCTSGAASLDALTAAGADNLDGKVLIDVANPLDFSGGGPALFTTSTESLGERIQAAFPGARVVKSLNTMNCNLMVDPASRARRSRRLRVRQRRRGQGRGARPARRVRLARRARDRPRRHHAARGTEMYLMLWLALMRTVGSANFNISVSTIPG